MKEETKFEDAVLKTVIFWSEKSFKTAFNQNNGDNSENGAMSFMLMNMVASKAQAEATPDKIKNFEEKLYELLIAEKENPYNLTLDVDYSPCRILGEAARFAGLNPSCLPCKTFTRIENDYSVTAKYQYGGEFIKL